MQYKITAWMLCHDLKFNEFVSIIVETEKEPTGQEIWKLLKPAANKVIEKYQGEGERYELNSIKVSKL